MRDRVFGLSDLCGDYKITGFLGSGGFAEVYEGAHVTTGDQVALKCLQLRHGESEYVTQRMIAEAELLATVDHQNLVQVVDFGKSGDVLYMAMERLRGRTLHDELKADVPRMPLERALYIACEIADGLDAAHERGVVHRDLKPDNVFLTEAGKVKVLDLGAGKFYGWGLASTAPGFVIGTVLYMAPEHVKGGAVDGRTDIYSLGVMLYEMCAGHPLAKRQEEGASRAEIALLQIQYEPPPLRSVAPEVPAYISAIVAKAMAKRPEDRFGSMSELAQALRRARGRYREELRGQITNGAAGDAPATSRPRTELLREGRDERSSSIPSPSPVVAAAPLPIGGGTDPIGAAVPVRSSRPDGAPLYGRGSTDPLATAAPVRSSTPDISLTDRGTVRMTPVSAPEGRGTEPLPSMSLLKGEGAGAQGAPSKRNGARNGALPWMREGEHAALNGVGARASMPASSMAPPERAPSAHHARTPARRHPVGIVLGFVLGVLLMGTIMLVRSRSGTDSVAPPPPPPPMTTTTTTTTSAAAPEREPLPIAEPVPAGEQTSPPLLPAATAGSTTSVAPVEPAVATVAAQEPPSVAPTSSGAKTSAARKPPATAASARSPARPSSTVKNPPRSKRDAGRAPKDGPLFVLD